MDAERYLGFFFGDKEEAIKNLEKWIPLYENSPNIHNDKVIARVEKYKRLLSEIKKLNNNQNL